MTCSLVWDGDRRKLLLDVCFIILQQLQAFQGRVPGAVKVPHTVLEQAIPARCLVSILRPQPDVVPEREAAEKKKYFCNKLFVFKAFPIALGSSGGILFSSKQFTPIGSRSITSESWFLFLPSVVCLYLVLVCIS